ncbi:MAG: hypothetical protein ACLQBQ_06030 [Smithella sp.]
MKQVFLIAAMAAIILTMAGWAGAGTSLTTNIIVEAQVLEACQEAQHGAFPNPLTIDSQSAGDQTFSPSADEIVKCSNGAVFTVKVSSANGTAIDQICTSSGVSTMAFKSAETPEDMIAYTFICAGDTDGDGHFTGAGYNAAKYLGINIKVMAANAQAAMAHADYEDTVTLTFNY